MCCGGSARLRRMAGVAGAPPQAAQVVALGPTTVRSSSPSSVSVCVPRVAAVRPTTAVTRTWASLTAIGAVQGLRVPVRGMLHCARGLCTTPAAAAAAAVAAGATAKRPQLPSQPPQVLRSEQGAFQHPAARFRLRRLPASGLPVSPRHALDTPSTLLPVRASRLLHDALGRVVLLLCCCCLCMRRRAGRACLRCSCACRPA